MQQNLSTGSHFLQNKAKSAHDYVYLDPDLILDPTQALRIRGKDDIFLSLILPSMPEVLHSNFLAAVEAALSTEMAVTDSLTHSKVFESFHLSWYNCYVTRVSTFLYIVF